MHIRFALAVVVVAGCSVPPVVLLRDFSEPGGDGPAASDQTVLVDLTVASDTALPPDQSAPPDLAVEPDLAEPPPDLTRPLDPDLALAPDLSIPPADLVVLPDFVIVLDLTAPTCSDGAKNQTETDVDCGGSSGCDPCEAGKGCQLAADCASRSCKNGLCLKEACNDGILNGGEADIDCGGICPDCALGKRCNGGADCATKSCINGLCTNPSCNDGVKNGDETDTDCGGSCRACAVNKVCKVGLDCLSKVCVGARCLAPRCDDGVLSNGESDIDCGGPCPGCPIAKACNGGGDCESFLCVNSQCHSVVNFIPRCVDGIRDGDETDLDCGGSCRPCELGNACGKASDCQSGVCKGGACSGASCVDGLRGAGETDVDCGGSCSRCPIGSTCNGIKDCASGICQANLCAGSSCNDNIRNGNESDVDCGGVCARCEVGKLCNVANDCVTRQCGNGTCFRYLPSCKAWKGAYPKSVDGVFTLDPENSNSAPFETVCDMTRDGGGWTFAIKVWYCDETHGKLSAVGTTSDALTRKGASYKLSDDQLRAVIGPKQNFDILVDQNGYNTAYSNGNFEYVTVTNYTAAWKFNGPMGESSTVTEFKSYRAMDNALAWKGRLSCGYNTGYNGDGCARQGTYVTGVNCVGITSGPNPAGGSGCNINLGKQSDSSWNHLFMGQMNSDTYLYICNGAQHTSSYDLNHRFWLR